jgi:regulatory protein
VTSEQKPETLLRLAAMNALARREHSKVELSDKLTRRFAEHRSLISDVLAGLEQDGLQSDRRYAEAFVRSRIQRGQGLIRVRGELKQRGVAADLIETVLSEMDVDWFALAKEVLTRRFGEPVPSDYSEKARCQRFLHQRGFRNEEIRYALEQGES